MPLLQGTSLSLWGLPGTPPTPRPEGSKCLFKWQLCFHGSSPPFQTQLKGPSSKSVPKPPGLSLLKPSWQKPTGWGADSKR